MTFISNYLATALLLCVALFSTRCHGNSLQLLKMVDCEKTGREGLEYNQYGRYCGLGNCGGHPVDQLDHCCKNHDRCYDKLSGPEGRCREGWDTYFMTYKIGRKGCTDCAKLDSYKLNDADARCKVALCACDATLTRCLKKQDKHYDKKNVGVCARTRSKKGYREMKSLTRELNRMLNPSP